MYTKKSKVRFSLVSLLLTVAMIFTGIPFVGADNVSSIVIYHTNDIHGRVNSTYSGGDLTQLGLDVVKTVKNSTPNSILVDAGDATQGTPIGKYSKGENIIKLMNLCGYDGMTLGNHEFDYGKDAVKHNAEESQFPVVSANTFCNDELFLKDVNGNNGCNFIKEINGKKIGFFGITTPETMKTTIPANLEGMSFKDEVNTSREQVNELRKQNVDLVVALFHVGIDSSSNITSHQIIEQVDGIDIVIDGHSHSTQSTRVNNTLIQQIGTGAAALGKIEINFNNNDFTVNGTILKAKEVGEKFKADPTVTNAYKDIESGILPILNKVVGKTETSLFGGNYNGKNVSRMVETNLGSLIGDAMIYNANKLIKDTNYADIPLVSFENGGAVRSKIPAGYITMENIIEVLPLDNKISIQKITPKILYQVMERGVCKQNDPKKAGDPIDGFFGGFPQISGVRIEYNINETPYNTEDPQNMIGNRVDKVVLLNEDNTDKQVLDRNDDTTPILFACNDYTITEYPMVSDINVLIKGDYLSNVLSEYITKLTIDNGGAFNYPLNQNRSKLLKDESLFKNFDSVITVLKNTDPLINTKVKIAVDNNEYAEETTDENGKIVVKSLATGGHIVKIKYDNMYMDAYVDETVGLKDSSINLENQSDKNVNSVINIISQIPQSISEEDKGLIKFARNSYNSLSPDEQAKITNYDLLLKAEGIPDARHINYLVLVVGALLVLAVIVVITIIIKKRKKVQTIK